MIGIIDFLDFKDRVPCSNQPSDTMTGIDDVTAAMTACSKEDDTASHAELRAEPCNGEKARWAVLPHDSGLRSSAVAVASEARATTSTTVPASPAERTSTSVPSLTVLRQRRQLTATKPWADIMPLDFDLRATPTPAALPPTSWIAANWASGSEMWANTGDKHELRGAAPLTNARPPRQG